MALTGVADACNRKRPHGDIGSNGMTSCTGVTCLMAYLQIHVNSPCLTRSRDQWSHGPRPADDLGLKRDVEATPRVLAGIYSVPPPRGPAGEGGRSGCSIVPICSGSTPTTSATKSSGDSSGSTAFFSFGGAAFHGRSLWSTSP